MIDSKKARGNIGDSNLEKLQSLRDKGANGEQAEVIPNLAARIDANYEAILDGDAKWPEIAKILRDERKIGKGVLEPDYYLRCATRLVKEGFYKPEEDT